tara:strand:- start:739 stop:1167 length:429 start_codon:yes stop_codon:yes gene_type:complete
MINAANYINYDKCTIYLEKYESNYLIENIKKHFRKNYVDIKYVKKALHSLMENSDVRYYSLQHINEISEDLSARINEELGKNRQSTNTMPYQNLQKVLDNETFDSITFTTDTYTGRKILNIDGKSITFNDEAAMDVYIRNLI